MSNIYKIENGPVLVLAGPGTGKTHTIAQRARFLIKEKEVPPQEISIITFTKEASFETRARLSDVDKEDVYLAPDKQPKTISTMHSLGDKILRANTKKAQLKKEFQVVSDDRFLMSIMEDSAQLNGYPREYALEVKNCRTFELCNEKDDDPRCKVCKTYRQILRTANAIDHDEQIRLACKLLSKYSDVHKDWLKRAKHLLVDEYQDINASQFEMIKLLSKGQEKGLFVVGDDDQSIYSWRGGTPKYIRNFTIDFKDHDPKVESLPICWRCPKSIHKGAVAVVAHFDTERKNKVVINYKNPLATKINCISLPSEKSEAKFIANLVNKTFPAYSSLVLIPKWDYANPIKSALRGKSIPYDLPMRIQESDLALFEDIGRWLSDTGENLVLRNMIRIILETEKSIGKPSTRWSDERFIKWNEKMKPISKLWEKIFAKEYNSSLMEALKSAAAKSSMLEKLFNMLQTIWEDSKKAPADFLNSVARNLSLWKQDTGKLIEEITDWCEAARIPGPGRELVRIMTMNNAKGLSADYVFVVGLENEAFPGDVDKEVLQEKCRLFFVSMTRAKRELFLLWTRKRSASYTYKALDQNEILSRSQFIESIPPEHIENDWKQSFL
ncbi:ATP-dependent helicase [candidate division WOR-3 bacterium]|nr:ATP-dependent helicase [candidate division WOR-3 bacterium]